MRQELTTTFNDIDGGKHQYELVQHPATAGLVLFQRLLEAVAHPAGAMLSAFQASGSIPEELTPSSVIGLFMDDGLDGEKIGVAADIFVKKVGMNMDLFNQLLKYTTRDGVPLDAQFNFDSAYTGNYMELFAAVAWSARVNFGSMMGAHSFPFASAKPSALKVKPG